MIADIVEKNDGIERCLEDDFICSVQDGDDDDYLKKSVTIQSCFRTNEMKIKISKINLRLLASYILS